MNVTLATNVLVGFLLAFTRTVPFLFLSPPFSSAAVNTRAKLALAAAFSLPLANSLPYDPNLLATNRIIPLVVYEVFIGVSLGFLVNLIFGVVQAAGNLLDYQAGFAAAQLYDPFSQAAATPLGRFQQLLALMVLIASNGHLLIFRGFLLAYKAAPLRGPRLNDLARVITTDAGQFLLAAVEIAAPLLGALFLTELVLGMLTKAAPQLNILKILLVLVLSGIAVPIIGPVVSRLTGDTIDQMSRLLGG